MAAIDQDNNTPLNTARVLNALRPALAVGAILFLLWLIFFWRILTPNANDRLTFDQDGDFLVHFYAPTAYQVQGVQAGELPLWNPYNFGGMPSAANIASGTFYPAHYITAFLAGNGNYAIEAYQLETAAHYLLASLLMFLYLRLLLRRSDLAVIGAVLYAYSGFMSGYPMLQTNILATNTWLPLALLGLHLSMTRPTWRIGGCALAGIGIGLMLLAGHPQIALYLIVLTMVYGVFLGWREGKPLRAIVWRLLLIGVVGVGLAAVQLLPTAEFYQHSFRLEDQDYADKAGGFMPSELAHLVWPTTDGPWSPLYIGIAGLVLAVGAVALINRREIRFWGAIFIIALLLSLGINTILFDVFYVFVPGFNLFRNQERLAILTSLALTMLAVYQLAVLSADTGDPQADTNWRPLTRLVYGIAAFLAGVAIIGLLILNLKLAEDVRDSVNMLSFSALMGGLLAAWIRWAKSYGGPRWHQATPLLLIVVIDLFTLGTRSANFVPDIPENHTQIPASLSEYTVEADALEWRVDGAAGLQGRGVHFQIPDVFGAGPLHLNSIEHLYELPVDRLWEIMAVRYVTTSDEPPPNVPLELLAYDVNYSGHEFRVFELADPRPLAHLVYDYRMAFNPLHARQIMADSQVDLREMGVTQEPLPFELPAQRPTTSTIQGFTIESPERIQMRVSTPENALLTIAILFRGHLKSPQSIVNWRYGHQKIIPK